MFHTFTTIEPISFNSYLKKMMFLYETNVIKNYFRQPSLLLAKYLLSRFHNEPQGRDHLLLFSAYVCYARRTVFTKRIRCPQADNRQKRT